MSALRAATPAPSGTTKKVGKWLDILHVSESARKDRKELIYLLLKCALCGTFDMLGTQCIRADIYRHHNQ